MYDRPRFRPDPSLEEITPTPEIIRRARKATPSSSPPQYVPRAPAPRSRSGVGIAWFISLVAVFLVIAVLIYAASVRTTTQPDPTNTPPQPPPSYPNLASTYQGSVHNTTYDKTATLTLANIVQDQSRISGNVIVGSDTGLGGNGPFTGEIQSNGDLSFTDNISDACCMATIITFVGLLHADGSMDGTYTTNANEQGTWQTTPN